MEHVSLAELAAQTGFSHSNMKRTVQRKGFEPYQLKKGQNAQWFLPRKDADAFIQQVRDERALMLTPRSKATVSTGISGVYAINVSPCFPEHRIKIGWSNNLNERLSQHRTVAFDLEVLAYWVTNNAWLEQAALTWARHHGKQIAPEQFTFDDVDEAMRRLCAWFEEIGITAQTSQDGD